MEVEEVMMVVMVVMMGSKWARDNMGGYGVGGDRKYVVREQRYVEMRLGWGIRGLVN